MTGASITVTDVVPNLGKKLIYFTVTLDTDEAADFSAYSSVDWVSAVDVDTLVPEPATAYTAGGDIIFTNDSNVIKGIALVNL
jgi:hypothetical protein